MATFQTSISPEWFNKYFEETYGEPYYTTYHMGDMAEADKPKVDRTIQHLFQLKPLPLPDTKRFDEYIRLHNLPMTIGTPIVDPKGYIGIEVEAENILKIDQNLELGFWQRREDGSLRNHGIEFVTHPIPASYAPAALISLFSYINESLVFSKRCSTHVHLNVRNLTMEQLFNILYVYHVVEPLLFKFVGGERDRNIFCVPWTSSETFQEAMALPLNKALRNFSENTHKYTALNLVPIGKFGTLEFRHLPGMRDTSRIVAWINLLLSLKVAALKTTKEELLASIVQLNTNSQYRYFVESIFGDLSHLLDLRDLNQLLEEQVTTIKDSVITNKFHTEMMAELKPHSQLTKMLNEFIKHGGRKSKKKNLTDGTPYTDWTPYGDNQEARMNDRGEVEFRERRIQVILGEDRPPEVAERGRDAPPPVAAPEQGGANQAVVNPPMQGQPGFGAGNANNRNPFDAAIVDNFGAGAIARGGIEQQNIQWARRELHRALDADNADDIEFWNTELRRLEGMPR